MLTCKGCIALNSHCGNCAKCHSNGWVKGPKMENTPESNFVFTTILTRCEKVDYCFGESERTGSEKFEIVFGKSFAEYRENFKISYLIWLSESENGNEEPDIYHLVNGTPLEDCDTIPMTHAHNFMRGLESQLLKEWKNGIEDRKHEAALAYERERLNEEIRQQEILEQAEYQNYLDLKQKFEGKQ